jgi:hypothetical protein
MEEGDFDPTISPSVISESMVVAQEAAVFLSKQHDGGVVVDETKESCLLASIVRACGQM